MNKPMKYRYEEVAELYNLGYSYKEIGNSLSITEAAVASAVQRARQKGLVTYNTKISEEVINKIITLASHGHSKADITRITGVSKTTVAKYIKKYNVDYKKNARLGLLEKIADLYNLSGYTYRQIAVECGISESMVNHYLKKARDASLIRPFKGRTTQYREVARLYNEGCTSTSLLMKKICASRDTVLRCIKTAQNEGLIVIDNSSKEESISNK